MRYLYTVLFYLALPFFFLRLLWRSRKNPAYRHRWEERLGFSPQQLKNCIWVHAVSVGETIAAIPLIKALKKEFPDLPLLVTNMTPTGAVRTKAAFGDTVLQAYIPYDLPDAVARFLERIHPSILIVMETELWPNLYHECKKRNIPILLANARLSEKSARGYQMITPLTRDIFSSIRIVASQAKADAERFILLGMPKDRVQILGNLKFDLELPADLENKSEILRSELGKKRFIWIAASTHQGEEEIIFEAHRLIRLQIPDALLILSPRHPERFDTVAALATQFKFSIARRSLHEKPKADTAVYLGDTMGELLLMYSAADVAFVAGSFAAIGGHNMLEPAALGKPIITGPQLFNFAEISELLFQAEGMVKVNDAKELAAAVIRFFQDEKYWENTGKNAKKVVEANRGAVKKHVELVKEIITS